MLIVTTDALPGWQVHRVCGEVYGVVLRAVTGPEAERALVASRAEAIARMLDQARARGGNAVVGLRFDASALGDGTGELCAAGTAVVAVPVDEPARQTAAALGYGPPGGAGQPAQ